MTEEEVLNKVKKLLNLGNSSDSAESRNALVRAHELMAKYNVQLEQIKLDSDIVEHECESLGTKSVSMFQWDLAREISQRYGCRLLRVEYGRKQRLSLVGIKVNTIACFESIKFAWNAYQSCYKAYIKKVPYETLESDSKRQLRKDYFLGFLYGLVNEMRKAECNRALVITEPKEVQEFMDKNFGKIKHIRPAKQSLKSMDTVSDGYTDGAYAYRNKNSAVEGQESTPSNLLLR